MARLRKKLKKAAKSGQKWWKMSRNAGIFKNVWKLFLKILKTFTPKKLKKSGEIAKKVCPNPSLWKFSPKIARFGEKREKKCEKKCEKKLKKNVKNLVNFAKSLKKGRPTGQKSEKRRPRELVVYEYTGNQTNTHFWNKSEELDFCAHLTLRYGAKLWSAVIFDPLDRFWKKKFP